MNLNKVIFYDTWKLMQRFLKAYPSFIFFVMFLKASALTGHVRPCMMESLQLLQKVITNIQRGFKKMLENIKSFINKIGLCLDIFKKKCDTIVHVSACLKKSMHYM